jgi:hypothetical protein
MTEEPGMENARENLIFIRQTMESAGQLTAVPGRSMMITGFLALAGAGINGFVTGTPWSPKGDLNESMLPWGVVLFVSLSIMLWGIYRKSRRQCTPIRPPLLRRLLWSLCPALFVGAMLTDLSIRTSNLEWLPVIWLGCYGAAIANSGMFSVTPIRYMGLCFLLTAGGAAVSSPKMGLVWIALGFGWLHILYGAYIARRHND